MRMRTTDDLPLALATAKQFTQGICRCGHTDSDHLSFKTHSPCAECRCRAFEALIFTIELIDPRRVS